MKVSLEHAGRLAPTFGGLLAIEAVTRDASCRCLWRAKGWLPRLAVGLGWIRQYGCRSRSSCSRRCGGSGEEQRRGSRGYPTRRNAISTWVGAGRARYIRTIRLKTLSTRFGKALLVPLSLDLEPGYLLLHALNVLQQGMPQVAHLCLIGALLLNYWTFGRSISLAYAARHL